ncbi:MAG: phage Gp37/Gp68 family protein [Bacteroidota bacterium]|nr:phage Gp37/Gp68 family protein [Bacteroidota bacterium]
MKNTKIEWTETTWNPSTGCTHISEGCRHCYAERMAGRLKTMGIEKYRNGFDLTIHPDALKEPFHWKKPRIVFVNSMSDLFHENMPFEFVASVFDVMNKLPQHTFQILTKRGDVLRDFAPYLIWTDNIWMGVTVENPGYLNRIKALKIVNAHMRFISMEPLLSYMPDTDLSGIHWVIVGGESGPGARPIKEEWVLDIKESCKRQSIDFFFKQWGGTNKKKTGRLLQGQTWDEMPVR